LQMSGVRLSLSSAAKILAIRGHSFAHHTSAT
jgi:hypothetical protein